MKKILFLTDFSEVAENAFVYALSLAEKLNANVHILHVTHIIESDDPEEQSLIHPLAEFYNERVEEDDWFDFKTEAEKLELIAKNNAKLNVPVEFHFEKGYFQDVVMDYVTELEVDVVVMGTSGANTVDKKIFGSNTEKMINDLKVPLLAVPENATFKAVHNFTLAVLLKEDEYKIVNRLATSLDKSIDSLKCVYIANNEAEAKNAESKEADWRKNFINPNIDLQIIINSDVLDGLKEAVQTNKTDVLCIIHRNLNFMQRLFKTNYSKRLLQHSSTALLIYNNE